jgi:hypothetical protein
LGVTGDIGNRIEIVPMDPHFHDITLALYQQQTTGAGEVFRVHTYSSIGGAHDRVAFVSRAMSILGGMQEVPDSVPLLRFPCGDQHTLAARRVFLEACKIAPSAAIEPRALSIFDKKSGQDVRVRALGAGSYDVIAGSDAARASAIAGGLAKLGAMSKSETEPAQVAFACGQSHDALVGLLLVRALNVRAVLREEEVQATRGTLAAPSTQQ